ncbi:MAG: hypothetical protein KDC92_01995, partial [Bacteroidetes bacterium]|nr:hypothetical protein [Bacteroidota bacterium]
VKCRFSLVVHLILGFLPSGSVESNSSLISSLSGIATKILFVLIVYSVCNYSGLKRNVRTFYATTLVTSFTTEKVYLTNKYYKDATFCMLFTSL